MIHHTCTYIHLTLRWVKVQRLSHLMIICVWKRSQVVHTRFFFHWTINIYFGVAIYISLSFALSLSLSFSLSLYIYIKCCVPSHYPNKCWFLSLCVQCSVKLWTITTLLTDKHTYEHLVCKVVCILYRRPYSNLILAIDACWCEELILAALAYTRSSLGISCCQHAMTSLYKPYIMALRKQCCL